MFGVDYSPHGLYFLFITQEVDYILGELLWIMFDVNYSRGGLHLTGSLSMCINCGVDFSRGYSRGRILLMSL
jgi:hypothetical protein